jgi:glycosyltransferase involved in cell wall biosynthesis
MTSPLRVLHVVNWLNRGGIETWLLRVLQHADRRRLVMDVCCKGRSTGELSAPARATGAAILHVPMRAPGPWDHRFRRALAEIIRAGAYDVVHSHLGDLSVPVLDAARRAGVDRRIVMYHQIEHRLEHHPALRLPMQLWQRSARREIAAKATRIVGCSRSVLSRVYPQAHGDQFDVVHPAVDVRSHDFGLGARRTERRRDARRKLGISDDGLLVVNVGSLNYAKNQRIILDVAERAAAAGIDATYVIVGHGPLSGELARAIVERRLERSVRLVGLRSDVAEWLCAADVALHPSIAEGLPVSVLEYQAASLPVIGSSIEPVLEALAPANRAIASAPHDACGFAATLERLSGSVDFRDHTAAAGRQWVVERFSMERNLADLSTLYA